MKTLHQDNHDWLQGPRWRVTQDPTMAARPDLIRFVKLSGSRKLLDQIARWTGSGWDQSRYVPEPPAVPVRVLERVEAVLRGEVEA